MYLNGKIIGKTKENLCIYVDIEKTGEVTFTAAEFKNNEMVGVYGLHIEENRLYHQDGTPVGFKR